MNNVTIALAVLVVWLGLGVVFLSMCRAASRADQDMDEVLGALNQPRTLRQHVFAVRARSLRTMHRLAGGRCKGVRTATTRERVTDQPALRPFHSA